MTVAIGKISGVQGFAYTLIEYDVVQGWVNLDASAGGGFTINVDQPIAAITIAPDSDVDQAMVSFPNILLGASGNPPQQSMRCGVGAPIVGRINAQGNIPNGEISISPSDFNYSMSAANAFFSAAVRDPEFPKLKLQIWWKDPVALPVRRRDWHSNGAEVTCDNTAQIIYRVGAWGRGKFYLTATGTDGVVITVNGRNSRNSGADISTVQLGTDTIATGVAEIGPIENKFFDVLEVTAQGIVGAKFKPSLRIAD